MVVELFKVLLLFRNLRLYRQQPMIDDSVSARPLLHAFGSPRSLYEAGLKLVEHTSPFPSASRTDPRLLSRAC